MKASIGVFIPQIWLIGFYPIGQVVNLVLLSIMLVLSTLTWTDILETCKSLTADQSLFLTRARKAIIISWIIVFIITVALVAITLVTGNQLFDRFRVGM